MKHHKSLIAVAGIVIAAALITKVSLHRSADSVPSSSPKQVSSTIDSSSCPRSDVTQTTSAASTHMSIAGISPGMPLQQALAARPTTQFGNKDGVLELFYGNGAGNEFRVTLMDKRVKFVQGQELEINGVPTIRKGEPRSQCKSQFPQAIESSQATGTILVVGKLWMAFSRSDDRLTYCTLFDGIYTPAPAQTTVWQTNQHVFLSHSGKSNHYAQVGIP